MNGLGNLMVGVKCPALKIRRYKDCPVQELYQCNGE